MIIDKDGNILGTTTKVYKKFDTLAEYNTWKASIPASAENIVFDVDKRYQDADPVIIPVKTYADLQALTKDTVNVDSLYFTLDTKLFYYCTVSGNTVNIIQEVPVTDRYVHFSCTNPLTNMVWTRVGTSQGDFNTGFKNVNMMHLYVYLDNVPTTVLGINEGTYGGAELNRALTNKFPTSLGHVDVHVPGVAIFLQDSIVWGVAGSLEYYPDTPGKFHCMMHVFDSYQPGGTTYWYTYPGEAQQRWDLEFQWLNGNSSKISRVEETRINH